MCQRMLCVGLVFWAFVTGGCASVRQPASAKSLVSTGPVSLSVGKDDAWLYTPQEQEYVLDIGDVFDLRLLQHPELNDAGVVVRPDGKVSVPLGGELVARGRTPSELSGELAEAYTRAGVRQAKVSILLRRFAGLRVFVGGEVNNPGMISHDGRLTLSRAVVQAGGPRRSGKMRSVVLLRRPRKDDSEQPLFAVVDLKKILAGGMDPLLQPYDVIFIPPSRITMWNEFMEHYFRQALPVTLTAGFEYWLGGSRLR